MGNKLYSQQAECDIFFVQNKKLKISLEAKIDFNKF